jgi:endonuclease YncB( thermonuclease family)
MRVFSCTAILPVIAGLTVIDGDTVHSAADRYRLLGIDAAEIHHAACEAERRLGALTRSRLETLLKSGPVELCSDQPGQRDKFGRLLVYFLVNGEDASCILIREGYARPWRGKREDWCVKTDLVKISDPSVDCTATGSIEPR